MVLHYTIKHCGVSGLVLLCWRWHWQPMQCSSVFL